MHCRPVANSMMIKAACPVLLVLLLGASALAQDKPGETKAPRAISFPQPVYPEEARQAGLGGTVRVSVTIDKKGRVTVLDAFGPDAPCTALDDKRIGPMRKAAVEAAKKAIFEQPMIDGKPSEIGLTLKYDFKPSVPVTPGTPKRVMGGVINGRALELPKPFYPLMAHTEHISGTVSVSVLIDENGVVVSAGAISGHQYLQDAAVHAACRAKFSPTLLSGAPVKVSGIITYNFAL